MKLEYIGTQQMVYPTHMFRYELNHRYFHVFLELGLIGIRKEVSL